MTFPVDPSTSLSASPPTGGVDGSRVRIPADINVADRVLAGLTVRQLALVAPAVLMAVCLFWLLSPYLPVAAVAAVCVPVAGAGIAVALGRWGGLPADRYLAAAASYAREPKLYLPATDDSSVGGEAPAAGWLPDVDSARRAAAPARPLATSVDAAGVLDLGADGVAVLAEVDGVNLTLGSVAERAAKATAFARTLNALAGPLQITIRATPVRLAPTSPGYATRHGSCPIRPWPPPPSTMPTSSTSWLPGARCWPGRSCSPPVNPSRPAFGAGAGWRPRPGGRCVGWRRQLRCWVWLG